MAMNNSLAEVHPELVSEWSEKNLTLTPDDITFGSNKKVWWRGACGHEWQATLIDFIVKEYADKYSVLQVGTGDSPLTVPFYEKCGFVRSHIIPNFFTDNYDHPIFECGVRLVDMVIFQRSL